MVGWSVFQEGGRPAHFSHRAVGDPPTYFYCAVGGSPTFLIVPWAGRPRSFTDRTVALVLPKLRTDCRAEHFLRMVIDFG